MSHPPLALLLLALAALAAAGCSPRSDSPPAPRAEPSPPVATPPPPAPAPAPTPAPEPAFEGRRAELLSAAVEDPWPDPQDPDPATRCWGRVAFALAAYALGRETAAADTWIRAIRSEDPFPEEPQATTFPCALAVQMLWRPYLDPAMGARMGPEAREDVRALMWSFVRRRSRLATARGDLWRIEHSENIDAIQKASYLLALEALAAAPSHGPDRPLDDGHPVAAHASAWRDWWMAYFRERAREGINLEIASPTYAKYTLSAYFGVRDFASDPALRARAADFLTLYFADAAQDFLAPAGIRGLASTRVYKDKSLTRSRSDSLRQWLWVYGWHDAPIGRAHPLILTAATSAWEPPAIVRAQATDRAGSYSYVSRRPGRGLDLVVEGVTTYPVQVEGGSHELRTMYVTPDYVLGVLSFGEGQVHNALAGQNRAVGVAFASDPEARLAVYGAGTAQSGRTGYREINGIAARGAALLARDPRASHSLGTRIFLPAGELWENRDEAGGWLFSRAGNAYLALRIAQGGHRAESVPDGQVLELLLPDSPLAIQMGRAADYPGYEAFRSSVLANAFQLLPGPPVGIRYESEAGDVLEYQVASSRSPGIARVNGLPVDLNPPATYASPFLTGLHGSDVVDLTHPLHPPLRLDFSDARPELQAVAAGAAR
jgi:hypothetical protein